MKQRHLNLSEECRSVSEILSRVGDKWTVLVVNELGERPKRFSELQRAIYGISQKMLTATLRGLERDGFCTRKVFPTVPPRVEYALTPLGRDLLVPVKALGKWALDNNERIAAARRRFDSQRAGVKAGSAKAGREPLASAERLR